MKTSLIIAIGLTLFSCKKQSISPTDLIGKWNNSYQIKYKDGNGKWGDWKTLNTLVALPTIEFTIDNKILWDGKQSDYCCTPRTYKLIEKNILTYQSGSFNCALVSCVAYQDWIIEKLTLDTLEINQYYTKVRYLRAK